MTADHIAAIRADAKRAADSIAYSSLASAGVLPSDWAILLGSLAGNAGLACDEVERLRAELADARRVADGLAERVAAQSALLSKRSEVSA